MSELIITPEQREQMRYCASHKHCVGCNYSNKLTDCVLVVTEKSNIILHFLDALEAAEAKLEVAKKERDEAITDRDCLAGILAEATAPHPDCPDPCPHYVKKVCSNADVRAWLNFAAMQRKKAGAT